MLKWLATDVRTSSYQLRLPAPGYYERALKRAQDKMKVVVAARPQPIATGDDKSG